MSRFFAPALLACVVAWPAFAAAPDNADPALAPWFNSLTTPAGGSCCAEADGHILKGIGIDLRITGDAYEVLVAGAWYRVPGDRVLERVDNPTGRYVAFYSRYYDAQPGLTPTVYCFVRPAET